MADHSKPLITSTYANFVSELDGRFDDLTLGLDPAVTSPTNLPTGAIRWNSSSYKWEKWSGSAWADLSPYYNINLSGPLSLTANSASDALRITQTGAGNALLVEDSSNPDSTPFVVSGTGDVGIGKTSPAYKLDVVGTASVSSNMLVGGTLGVTGVTTFSSNPIYSAGTANGVVYLNGSKVATTGSALTFDGTNLAVGYGVNDKSISVGGAGGYGSYQLNGGNSTGYLFGSFAGFGDGVHLGYNFYKNAAGTSIIPNSSGSTSLITTSYGFVSFSTGATNSAPTEQMRLTSTGLGIGTSSPSAKLDVIGTGLVSSFGSSTVAETYVQVKNGTSALYLGGSSSYNYVYGTASVPLTFWTNSTERMRIDSSGNLGLGVTPSAWQAGGNIDGLYNFTWASYDASIGSNYYYNAGYKYKATGAAVSKYSPYLGAHTWYTAPSGTAGNAITFTQAMTLDASGNLIVGGTSALVSASTRGNITVNGASNSILSFGIGGVARSYIFQSGTDFSVWNLDNAPMLFGTNNTERMRIDSSGNVGIGTSVINCSLEIYRDTSSGGATAYPNIRLNNNNSVGYTGLYFFQGTLQKAGLEVKNDVSALTFSAGGSAERMRIDSSGNVGIGTSSPGYKLDVQGIARFKGSAISDGVQTSILATGITDNNFTVNTLNGTTGASGSIVGEVGMSYATTKNSYIKFYRGDATGGWMTFTTNNDTERMRLDSSGNLLFNSGYGSVATAYGCRAWVNFNGTGTVAIRASGNVSSITDNGTGNYTVNFSTAMPDTNYSFHSGIRKSDATATQCSLFCYNTDAKTTSTLQLRNMQGTGTLADSPEVNVAIFR